MFVGATRSLATTDSAARRAIGRVDEQGSSAGVLGASTWKLQESNLSQSQSQLLGVVRCALFLQEVKN